jgi:hypothetical protein
MIEANWGDMISVTVYNDIAGPEEGTAIHWHGISQKGTPYYDGVPGVTQCPIAPGSSFTYTFKADVYGTSWWHSHFSAQYTAGVFGPLIVYGPKHVDYDIDIGPVMLNDWYHADYTDTVADAVGPSQNISIYAPWADNNLINGRNTPYDCSLSQQSTGTCDPSTALPRAQYLFQMGKTHRLRLMNTGAAALMHFSIDGHNMQVIANDFVPVVPYDADFVTLHVGQRTDILVTGDADPTQSYWIRSTISMNCSDSYTTEALAILSYAGYNATNQTPNSTISAAAAAADEKSFLCQNVRHPSLPSLFFHLSNLSTSRTTSQKQPPTTSNPSTPPPQQPKPSSSTSRPILQATTIG